MLVVPDSNVSLANYEVPCSEARSCTLCSTPSARLLYMRCNHIFCETCITTWRPRLQRPGCPQCLRTRVDVLVQNPPQVEPAMPPRPAPRSNPYRNCFYCVGRVLLIGGIALIIIFSLPSVDKIPCEWRCKASHFATTTFMQCVTERC